MKSVYKTPYTSVIEHDGIITVRRRSQVLFIMIGLGLVIGALAYLVSGTRLTTDGALERFCFWAGTIILALSGLMSIVGVLQSRRSKTVFDCYSQTMHRGALTCRFSEIEQICLKSTLFAGSELFVLTAAVSGKSIELTSDTAGRTLEEVARFLNDKLAVGPASAAAMEAHPPAGGWAGRHFIGLLLIGLGLIWTGTGFFWLRRLIFTGYGSEHGPLIWPLGIWMVGLGLVDLIGYPLSASFQTGSRRSKAAVAAVIVYFGLYLLLCWR